MAPVRSWSERIAQAVVAVGRWARIHVAVLLVATLLLGGLVVRRRGILDRLATLAFWLSLDRDPRRRVLSALTLLERRARWAGRPRPSSLTPRRWYQPLIRQESGEPRASLDGLIRLADWAIHAPDGPESPAPAIEDDIQQTCRSAVRAWTLARFRHTISSPLRKEATT